MTDAENTYFTNGAGIHSCPLGPKCTDPKTLVPKEVGGPYHTVALLAVSPTDVFYVRTTGETTVHHSIRSVPIGGGASSEVCRTHLLGEVNSMVYAGGYLYFTSRARERTTTIYQWPRGRRRRRRRLRDRTWRLGP